MTKRCNNNSFVWLPVQLLSCSILMSCILIVTRIWCVLPQKQEAWRICVFTETAMWCLPNLYFRGVLPAAHPLLHIPEHKNHWSPICSKTVNAVWVSHEFIIEVISVVCLLFKKQQTVQKSVCVSVLNRPEQRKLDCMKTVEQHKLDYQHNSVK